jgi:hypothetical protein
LEELEAPVFVGGGVESDMLLAWDGLVSRGRYKLDDL